MDFLNGFHPAPPHRGLRCPLQCLPGHRCERRCRGRPSDRKRQTPPSHKARASFIEGCIFRSRYVAVCCSLRGGMTTRRGVMYRKPHLLLIQPHGRDQGGHWTHAGRERHDAKVAGVRDVALRHRLKRRGSKKRDVGVEHPNPHARVERGRGVPPPVEDNVLLRRVSFQPPAGFI